MTWLTICRLMRVVRTPAAFHGLGDHFADLRVFQHDEAVVSLEEDRKQVVEQFRQDFVQPHRFTEVADDLQQCF